jgi:hypothetical protein
MTEMVRVGPLSPYQRAEIEKQIPIGKPNPIREHAGEFFVPLRLEDFQRLCQVQRRGESMADTLIDALKNGVAGF